MSIRDYYTNKRIMKCNSKFENISDAQNWMSLFKTKEVSRIINITVNINFEYQEKNNEI